MRRMLIGVVLVGLAAGLWLPTTGHRWVRADGPRGGGISYASRPDEAALYLNDLVFVRDTAQLPAGDLRVLLPPGTFPNTLILTENGARVRSYRITPQGADVYYSQASFRYGSASYGMGGQAYALTWESAVVGDTRTITLEYLMTGAHWSPTYDMTLLDDQSVALAFFAEIENSALMLEGASLYLVAGRVDLSQQVNLVSQMTFNQYAVGYADTPVTLPDLGVGAISLQHIYPLEAVTAEPGDLLYVNLADATLPARRLLVWNAASEQEVDVIYKVTNATAVPFAEGVVRVFEDALFRGSDFIETTPVSSEGSVTVGSVPDVRVRRTLSSEYEGGATSYYLHTVQLEVSNFSPGELTLSILDQWLEEAWQFEYSLEPERQPDNLLQWEVTVGSGETLTITYSFRTKY